MVMERHKTFVKYLDIISKKKKEVIEIGCGFGNNIKMLKNTRTDIIPHALDFSEISIQKIKSEISNAYVVDCRDTKLPNDKFDFIYSSGLMEHFKDEKPFLKEMKRILNPDGIIATFIPARYSLWQLYQLLHFGNWKHGYEKSYTVSSLVNLFNEAGYKILDIVGVDPFSINGFLMKLLNKEIKPLFNKSFISSGYTEIGIIAKK